MKVRRAEAGDLADLQNRDFSFEIRTEAVPPFDDGWLERAVAVEPYRKSCGFDADELADHLAAEDRALFVIDGDDGAVGYIAVSTGWNRFAVIDDFALDTAWRGRGAAGILMEEAVAWAKRNGLPGISLETQSNNLAACRFYLGHGFELGGHDRHIYRGLVPDTREIGLFFYRFL